MALPLLVDRLISECDFKYVLSARIQNDLLEHHFGLYIQMSGAHYHITYCQILESERRLQLSNILKVFSTKLNSEEFVKPLSLVIYINKFAENACGEESDSSFDLQLYLETLQLIPKPQIHLSQIECLTYVAGYAVFSYIKKSNACANCHNFLRLKFPGDSAVNQINRMLLVPIRHCV